MKIVLAIILCTLLLTGCWDRTELNDIGIVVAVGVDKDDTTGKIIMTSQVVRPAALKREGGAEQASPVEIITTQGNTVAEAVKNISKQFDKQAFFAHVKVFVVSERLAREGLLPVLDFFVRNHNTRRLAWFIVAKGTDAREILIVKHGIENVQATYVDSIIKSRKDNSEVSISDILDYLKAVSSDSNPIAGAVEIVEHFSMPDKEKKELTTQAVKLSGTAVFKKDKLVGYLDNIETRGLNWATGKVKNAIVNVPSPDEEDKLIAIVIKKASSSITPEIKNGKISFTIEVNVEGDIGEQQDTADYFKNMESFRKIEKEQQAVIEQEIKLAVDKVQKELGSDVLGFGSAVNKKYPEKWQSIKDDWENIFPGVPYQVKVDAKLRRLGSMLKPVRSSDTE